MNLYSTALNRTKPSISSELFGTIYVNLSADKEELTPPTDYWEGAEKREV